MTQEQQPVYRYLDYIHHSPDPECFSVVYLSDPVKFEGPKHKESVMLAAGEVVRRVHAEDALRHDELTGLLNRKSMEEAFQRIVKGDEFEDNRYALVFADLDGFKGVNDTYGHAKGDEVLVQFSKMIRESDVAGRIGGDEFVMIVDLRNAHTSDRRSSERADRGRRAENSEINEQTKENVYQAIAGRLREQVAQVGADVNIEKISGFGVSIGLVPIRVGSSFEELKNVADGIMYQDKATKNERR
jgi:diguanylate cyclase (GGDEF)-like protein